MCWGDALRAGGRRLRTFPISLSLRNRGVPLIPPVLVLGSGAGILHGGAA